MLRSALIKDQPETDFEGFRCRGLEVTRIEGLTDGVFALAMTLLVLSAEVPRSYSQLLVLIKDLPSFAVCFALLMWFWVDHYHYSRRYGLTDRTTIALNSVLVFVVLFYVYPLKMLFTEVLNEMLYGVSGDANGPFVQNSQWPSLFLLYGIGYASIALVYPALYLHALRLRTKLDLNAVEIVLTHKSIISAASRILVAAASIACAYVSDKLLPFAGLIYAATGAIEGVLGWYYRVKLAKLQAKAPTP